MHHFSTRTLFRKASSAPGHLRPHFWRPWLGLLFSFAAFSLECAADPAPGYPVTLEWDANEEPDVLGYNLYYGTASGVYTETLDAGNVTTATVSLTPGVPYFFAVTAYNTGGLESGFSNEVTFTAPLLSPLQVDYFVPAADTLPADGSPGFTSQTFQPDGRMSFTLLAQPGSWLRVEASADQSSWICLGLLENPTGGITITDPDAPRFPRRFYRIVQLPRGE